VYIQSVLFDLRLIQAVRRRIHV